MVAEALGKGDNTAMAAELAVAREYISMYAELGGKSNTMLFQDRPADVAGLMAQAHTVLGGLQGVKK